MKQHRGAWRQVAFCTFQILVLLNSWAFPQQTTPPSTETAVNPDKGKAYYHYTLSPVYQERASFSNRADLLAQALDELKLHLVYDLSSIFLSVELADLYASTGRWQNAVQEAEDAVKRNLIDLAARRLLGRLYVQLLTENRRMWESSDFRQRALQQFEV